MDFDTNADYYQNGNDIQQYGLDYHVIADLATEPVDLAFFKDHARIDFDTDDTLAASYLKAARLELEAYGQISFGVKTMRLTALELPKNYRLMYGPVNEPTTPGYATVGDILIEGGKNVNVTYTTLGIMNETIKIAICLVAAARYAIRENVIVNVNGTVQQPSEMVGEAEKSIDPFINKTWF